MDMGIAKKFVSLVDRSHTIAGQPFSPATGVDIPKGLYGTVHYGIMVPGLPEPFRFLNIIVLIGQPKARLFANPHLIETSAKDTANLLVGSATATPDHFQGYSVQRDCEFKPDGSYLKFGNDLVIEGQYPNFSVVREGHDFNLQLSLRATDKIAHFSRMVGGLYDHWSILCEYQGVIEQHGEKTELQGLCTYEYARAMNVNLPFRFFTYQIINIDENTQVLMVEVLGPFNMEVQRRVYVRTLDDHGGIYSKGFDFKVHTFESEEVVTPNGVRMRLPGQFSWRVEDDEGVELITIEGDCNQDFNYGMTAGYAGSYHYKGRFKGQAISGTGYIEYIDLRGK
ncbi:hypothetical protein OLMES_3922 [Oleiphilus messinensis]|uniref:Uncharacterized protein n=1 Tax=Oleiphilus messinensis TaxID=141451 RepID=A0A1Y0IBM5_9GAMM|nr:DUF6670 family protein [Oleiphilus messinensis]ARU57942.1 hypothetical protein OLMES_3922 [Oleiphilus messinensis]